MKGYGRYWRLKSRGGGRGGQIHKIYTSETATETRQIFIRPCIQKTRELDIIL